MTSNTLYRLRRIAEYQFGENMGKTLFPENIEVETSKRTGKIKRISINGRVIATLRPNDGLLALSIQGAKRIKEETKPPKLRAIAIKEVTELIERGRNLFAKHVKDADPTIIPGDEVIVVDEEDNVLAVGRAILTGKEMVAFKSGIAIKIRRGRME